MTELDAPCRYPSWLLFALAAAAVMLLIVLEALWYRNAHREMERQLARSAEHYATTLQERLTIHFERLRLIGEGILLPRWLQGTFPPAEPELDRLLREIVATHPSLRAFNTHDPSGNELLWTTRNPPPTHPIFAGSAFRTTEARTTPDELLTLPRLVPTLDPQLVIGARYAVRDPFGEVAFFVGSPLPAQLLFLPSDQLPSTVQLLVTDRRFDQTVAQINGTQLRLWHDGEPSAPPSPFPASHLPTTQCSGPYCVTAALVAPWQVTYLQQPEVHWRWAIAGGLLAAFLLALWRLHLALNRLEKHRRALAEALAQQSRAARTDPLTGLPNRLALQEQASRLLATASRHGLWLAVGVLDLDDFKPVNDQHGHAAGDLLLKALAARLTQAVRSTDLVGRLGGDEFVLLLDHLSPGEAHNQIAAFGERIEQLLSDPILLPNGVQVTLSYRIGWALYPLHGSDFDALLRRADAPLLLLKSSKRKGSARMAIANSEATAPAVPVISIHLDPFGKEAEHLLTAYQSLLLAAAEAFLPVLLAAGRSQPAVAALLAALLPSEIAQFQRLVFDHLKRLVNPTLSARQLARSATRLGWRHALVGLPMSTISWGYQQWHQFLQNHLIAAALRSDTIFRLLYLLRDRASVAEQHQYLAFEAVEKRYLRFPLTSLPGGLLTEREWEEELIAALARLPGLLFAALCEPDAEGCFSLLTAAGDPDAVRLLKETLFTAEYAPRTDPDDPRSHGLVAQAWIHQQICISNDYRHDPRSAQWREATRAVGLCSMAALPLATCRSTHPILILAGRTPYLFASLFVQHFLTTLKQQTDSQRLATAPLAPAKTPLLPIGIDRATAIRTAVMEGRLAIAVQPIVDLRHGTLTKVEALARLSLAEQLLLPGDFLPVLRTNELASLFCQILDRGLTWLARWHHTLPDLTLVVNIDAATLSHPELIRWIHEGLTAHAIAANRLMVELIASTPNTTATQHEALAALRSLGVGVAYDVDDNSSSSNLLWLAEQPFDTLKIDQSLVEPLLINPIPALAVLRSLVRLAEGLDQQVVAAGLEHRALAEVVSILGISQGQGYGIAMPMPPEALLDWVRCWHSQPWRSFPAAPLTTPLGALAYQWQINRERAFAQLAPLPLCPITEYLATYYPDQLQIRQLHETLHDAAASGDEARWRSAALQFTCWLEQQAVAYAQTLSGKIASSR